MKKKLSVLMKLVLIVSLLFGTSMPAGANTTVRTATVNTSVLIVRSGPGTTFDRIATVSNGQILPVLAERTGWVQISLSGGRTGWLAAGFVTLRNQQPAQWARITTAVLNVRSGPGRSFSRVTTVSNGTVLPVLQRNGDWLHVRLSSGQFGWVLGTFASLTAAHPSAGTQAPAPSPSPTSSPTPAPSPSPAPAPPANAAQQATVNVSVLNVRSGPGTTFGILTTVGRQTVLPVLQTQGEWLQVRLPSGQTGWVFAQHAILSPVSAPTPATEAGPGPAPTPVPAPATEATPLPEPTPAVTEPVNPEPSVPQAPETVIQRFATVTVSALNVRTGPDTSHAVITVLPQHTMVDVIGQQGDWLQVRMAGGQTGWVAGWMVSIFTRETTLQPGGSGSTNSPLAGRVITIDPGHGGTNPGAVGAAGLMEKEVVLDVSLRVAAKLRQAGATVVMTRDNDSTVYLSERVRIAQASNSDVFVSIHANAHPNRLIGGTETYYFMHRANAMESYYLAANIQNELAGALGLRDIGVKHGNFHVIRETTMPSVLVELAFISNAHEEALMRTNAFRENAADAIVRGLERYFR